MRVVVVAINRLFDSLFAPFCWFSPIIMLGLISLLCAILILWVFKKVSNQEKIKFHKDKIFGYILETRLYKDQFTRTIISQLNILKHNVLYMRFIITPLLAIIIPILIIMIQINNRMKYLPLGENEPFIIRAELDTSMISHIPDLLDRVQCETSPGIILETPPLRLASEASIFWRARVLSSDEQQYIRLGIYGAEELLEKKVATNSDTKRFIPQRIKWALRKGPLFTGEEPIPETSPFKLVSVSYTPAKYRFLIWKFDPVVLFVILTLFWGFLIKPLMGVKI